MNSQRIIMLNALTGIILLNACTRDDSYTLSSDDLLDRIPPLEDFLPERPLAVGAKLKLSMRDIQRNNSKSLNITNVESNNEAVFKASIAQDNSIIVEALASGNGTLTVTSYDEATMRMVTNTLELTALEVEVLTLSSQCKPTSSSSHNYFQNQPLKLDIYAKSRSGKTLRGYGYSPITFSHEDVTLVDVDFTSGTLNLAVGEALGPLELSSPARVELLHEINIVASQQIDGVVTDPKQIPIIEKDRGVILAIEPTIKGQSICDFSSTFSITSLTPDLCEINPDPELQKVGIDAQELSEVGWALLSPKEIGACQLELTYPPDEFGEGSTLTITIPITP